MTRPASDSTCVIPDCRAPVDRSERVEMAIPTRPYKELRPACRPHLDGFKALGLSVRPVAAA